MEFPLFFLANLVKLLKYAILVRVLLSWINPMGQGRINVFFINATEPVLKVFRAITPSISMIDLSPLLAFFAFDLMEYGIYKLLTQV
jgi:YggT family protein